MGRIRVGVSGWDYDSWRGAFYPEDLPRGEELAYAAQRFDILEVTSTFYGLREPATFVRWRDAVPDGVVLAVKGSRFITHQKKLRETGTAVANFLASGVLELGSRLGPILWQLPEQLHFDAERVEAFLAGLPDDTEAAADLACGPDELYASAYDEEALGHGARRLRRWRDGEQPDGASTITDRPLPERDGRDVDVCFNNDAAGYAPRQAARLRELLDEA